MRLAEQISKEQISVWYSVPSVLTMLVTYGNLGRFDLSRLRTVIFAGEVFPVKHLGGLMAALPHVRYLNWYGPTETNVCTSFEVPAGASPRIRFRSARPAPTRRCSRSPATAAGSLGPGR